LDNAKFWSANPIPGVLTGVTVITGNILQWVYVLTI